MVGTLGEYPTYDGATAPGVFLVRPGQTGHVNTLYAKRKGDTEYKQAKEFVDFLDSSYKVYYHNGYGAGQHHVGGQLCPQSVFDRTGKQVYLGGDYCGLLLNEGARRHRSHGRQRPLYLDESRQARPGIFRRSLHPPFNQGLSPLAKYDVEQEGFVFGFG